MVTSRLSNVCHAGSVYSTDYLLFRPSHVPSCIFLDSAQTTTFEGPQIGFFNPVILTQDFEQSRNPEGYFCYPTSLAYFQSRIPPWFWCKIPNPEPQIREIPYPGKPTRDPHFYPLYLLSFPQILQSRLFDCRLYIVNNKFRHQTVKGKSLGNCFSQLYLLVYDQDPCIGQFILCPC